MPPPEQVRLPVPADGGAGHDAGALGGLPPISELDAQRYDVQAGAELADTYDQVLKHGESFAVFDRHGDILPEGMGEEGPGTVVPVTCPDWCCGWPGIGRCCWAPRRSGTTRLAFDLTNTDLGRGPQRLPHSSVHLSRTKVLWDGVCHERLVARSFAREPVRLILTLRLGRLRRCLRGARHATRGARPSSPCPCQRAGGAALRRAGWRDPPHLAFSATPIRIERGEADFELDLLDERAMTIDVAIACETGRARRMSAPDFDTASSARAGR